MHVDRALEGIALRVPVQGVEKRLSRQHAATRLHKRDQQPEFRRREGQRRPRLPHFDAIEVDEQVDVLQDSASGMGPVRFTRPAQHRLDADDQLGRRERLGKVVVGALVDAVHAVGDRSARGQHDNGDGRALADDAHQGEAIKLGQHEVEHDQPGTELVECLQRSSALACCDHAEAFALEVSLDERHDLGIVVHDQDRGHGVGIHRKRQAIPEM